MSSCITWASHKAVFSVWCFETPNTKHKTQNTMTTDLLRQLRPALVLFLLFTLLTGVLYPLTVTGVAAVLFPDQAAGSLIGKDGKVVGSRLIGQRFQNQRYFWSRPSATGPSPYNAGS